VVREAIEHHAAEGRSRQRPHDADGRHRGHLTGARRRPTTGEQFTAIADQTVRAFVDAGPLVALSTGRIDHDAWPR
jgi:hypothetical protein